MEGVVWVERYKEIRVNLLGFGIMWIEIFIIKMLCKKHFST